MSDVLEKLRAEVERLNVRLAEAEAWTRSGARTLAPTLPTVVYVVVANIGTHESYARNVCWRATRDAAEEVVSRLNEEQLRFEMLHKEWIAGDPDPGSSVDDPEYERWHAWTERVKAHVETLAKDMLFPNAARATMFEEPERVYFRIDAVSTTPCRCNGWYDSGECPQHVVPK